MASIRMRRAETRILLAIDERLVCEVLGAALRTAGFFVVAEVHRRESVVERIEAETPDVAVVSFGLLRPEGSGVIERLIGGATPLLVVSSRARRADLLLARRLGASGFLSKTSTLEQLIEAVRALAAGHSYFPPDVSSPDPGQAPERARGARTPLRELTNRERQVLALIAGGMSSREIGVACHISLRTVNNHRENIMMKLGARKLSDLVRIAVREGIVEA